MTQITPQGRNALVTVAEWLEAGAPHKVLANGFQLDHFDMENAVVVDHCGTSCCIAGAVCQFEGLGVASRDDDGSLDWTGDEGAFELAYNFLGIDYDQAREMFVPWTFFSGEDDSFNSAPRGAAVIRHFLATGEVDWDRFDDEGNIYEVE